MLYDNLGVNDQGHLTVGGLDTVALAEEFGAPLYVLDEDQVRANCRTYRQAMAEWMPGGSLPLFAGKGPLLQGPLPCAGRRGHGGGCGLPRGDLHGPGGGFPAEKLYFHGNNKTDEDIAYALDCGVGCFIVDNHQELERLEQAAGARSHRQRVLLRVTPGLTPTLQAINTGRIDCQFGVPIETGQAAQFVADALSRPHLQVEGFHSHIGSQIFEAAPFLRRGGHFAGLCPRHAPGPWLCGPNPEPGGRLWSAVSGERPYGGYPRQYPGPGRPSAPGL